MSGRGFGLLDTEALYVVLDRKRRERRISWRQICREAGIPGASTTTRLAYGHPPGGENLCRLLLWLGETDVKPYLRQTSLAALQAHP